MHLVYYGTCIYRSYRRFYRYKLWLFDDFLLMPLWTYGGVVGVIDFLDYLITYCLDIIASLMSGWYGLIPGLSICL